MNTKPTCSIDGCAEPRFSHGYCTQHNNNFVRRGDPLKFPERRAGVHEHCTHDGCTEPHYGKGLCRQHYRRQHEGQHGLDCKPCEQCGDPTTRPDARFCGQNCQNKWHREHGSYTAGAMKLRHGTCKHCDGPVHAKGLCKAHYLREWRHGDALADVRPVALTHCTRCGADRMPAPGTRRQGNRELCGACYAQDYYLGEQHGKEKARRSERRQYNILQTPLWANMEAVAALYAACPPGHQVDHVIPLRGRKVSGLHVEYNLQYLTKTDNCRKGNRVV